MEISLDLWAAAVNAGIFLFLMAIPWVTGPFRPFLILLGVGGILCLLGFDFYIGVAENDYGLSGDLMLLTLAKAIFFFGVSLATEKIFRAFFSRSRNQQDQTDWHEEELSRTFDRNIRGLKDPNTKSKKR